MWTSGRAQSLQHRIDGPLIISFSVSSSGQCQCYREVWGVTNWTILVFHFISFSCLITPWPDSISGDGLQSGVSHQRRARLYTPDLKRKRISNLALGLFGSLVLGGWLMQSAGAQISSAQIVAFSQVSYIYLLLLLWLSLLTWLLQG